MWRNSRTVRFLCSLMQIHINCHYSLIGPPTQLLAYKALLQKEIENDLAGISGLGETQFVNNGLRIEFEQYVLRTYYYWSFGSS
jgi:hypothetical protein